MEITRKGNRFDAYDYCLKEGEKELVILFAGNLDLYMMMCDDQLMNFRESKTISFDITKADYDIFCLFDSLYKNIIKGRIFDMKDVKKTFQFEYSKLVDQQKKIHWISDEDTEEVGDSLTISKPNNDSYRLTFHRNEKTPDFGFKSPKYISIRFRNSGSRYKPFNGIFMQMYSELNDIDPDYRQICFEEYQYCKRMEKKKTTHI